MTEIKASSKRLTGKQKCFVITHLGCFETLGEVQNYLKDEFGIHISTQAIHKIGKRHKKTINKLKLRFQDSIHSVPIAIKCYRLKQLQHLFDSTQNLRSKLNILKLASMEAKNIEGLSVTGQKSNGHIDLDLHLQRTIEEMPKEELLRCLEDTNEALKQIKRKHQF